MQGKGRLNRNFTLAAAIICWPLFSILGWAQSSISPPDWDEILKAGRTYFSDPTSENALELYKALPETQVRGDRDGKEFRDVFYFFDAHLDLIRHQVLLADRNAVKVAVRLWTISDGAFSEVLSEVLGDLIQVDPKMFIEEIREFPWPKDYGDFDEWLSQGNILCDAGIEVSEEIRRKKLESRIRALETVTDSRLAKVRDHYISIIIRHLRDIGEYRDLTCHVS
jgi:hypothetical protein